MIISLWSISMLSAFAVIVGYQVRQRLTLAYRLDDREKLLLTAEAGARRGIAELLKDTDEDGYDHLNDAWSLNEPAFKDVDLAGAFYRVGYDYRNPISGSTKFWSGIMDENRKINLNSADISMMRRLFERVLDIDETDAQEIAAAVVDWRDADSELALPTAGAEDSFYHGLSTPYDAKDAPFEVLEELLLVRGVTREVFSAVQDFCTVYGEGGVNINTAPLEVLIALGLSEELAEDVITYRQGQDGEAGTEDDLYFTSPTGIVSQLSDVFALNADEINSINTLIGTILGTQSDVFSVRSSAYLARSKAVTRVWCVTNRKGEILYWGAE